MIDLQTASQLLDFSTRIGKGQRAQEQLEGAVAIHNILSEYGVAYLADEVGMGKTYVALGAMALLRHYQPNLRVLVIAPRENIQLKWMKELRNFVSNNIRYPDLRMKAIDGRPVRPLVSCHNISNLVQEVSINPNRDIFVRLSSFSMAISGQDAVDQDKARRLRDELRKSMPWIRDEVFDLRNKQVFKQNVAQMLCCALPIFDLVIVDEGHNLKHGVGENVAARNQVLSVAMGYSKNAIDQRIFPHYGPRAKRVLFLSATPVEETYRHLWNQLSIFGRQGLFNDLCNDDLDEQAKKAIVGKFLVRRVTQLCIGGKEYTKNLYRREWRRGGVTVHDEPIRIEDPKQRLIVALVQKKVSELLGHERFNSSFQIGMLASFESFLQTARVKPTDDVGNFDDEAQTQNQQEREGIDVANVNKLSHSYRETLGCEMPHPKMDALVEELSNAWDKGKKSLVFVRRINSVKELKRKLDERYDRWLMSHLHDLLPIALYGRLEVVFKQYRKEQMELLANNDTLGTGPVQNEETQDVGDKDTFFAWYFRGQGPRGLISGANVQQRFIQRGTVYSTFFEDNLVAEVLSCKPGQVMQSLSQLLGSKPAAIRKQLRERSRKFLSQVKNHARADRYEAAQASAIEWIKDVPGNHQELARIVWAERYIYAMKKNQTSDPPDIGDWLELTTFFTALRDRPELRNSLWPQSQNPDRTKAYREQELRAQMLAAAARLGHSLIDLYAMTIRRLGSLDLRTQETDDENVKMDVTAIKEYLDLLEKQQQNPLPNRSWSSFDELSDIAKNFDLILDCNEPEVLNKPLSETTRIIGMLLRQQQPVGGMFGGINKTLVRQFRMPGYPLILITTDLLQEGEDLHTFCSAIHHYGLAWTPSSMEQRIGRIDRVRSLTERRLIVQSSPQIQDQDKLQVYYPHLEDTVEVLQVQRVFERMNTFIRLMHEGLILKTEEKPTVDIGKEIIRDLKLIPQIRDLLKSAFPVRMDKWPQKPRGLAVPLTLSKKIRDQFAEYPKAIRSKISITWEPQQEAGVLLGTAHLKKRIQPFMLLLQSHKTRVAVKCISPIGCVHPGREQEIMLASAIELKICIGAIDTQEERTYDITVESGVLLTGNSETDSRRIEMMIQKVVNQADNLEQYHLPGKDEHLKTFRNELNQEVFDGR